MKKAKDKINNNSSAKISAPVKTSKVKPKSKIKGENKPNVIDNYDELSKSKVGSVSVKSGPSPYGRRQGAGLYEVPPSKDEIKEARRK